MAEWLCNLFLTKTNEDIMDKSTKDDLMSIEKEVIDIVVEQLGVDAEDVTSEKSFVEDLNADSLDLTELIMTFEERFGIEISEEDAEKIKSIDDAIVYIKNKKKKA